MSEFHSIRVFTLYPTVNFASVRFGQKPSIEPSVNWQDFCTDPYVGGRDGGGGGLSLLKYPALDKKMMADN